MAIEPTTRLSASPPLFQNRFLDFFSRIHPSVPAIIYIPVIAACLMWSAGRGNGGLEIVAWYAGGLAFWTLAEYWLHRKLFHWQPDNAFGRRMHFIIHGVHHDHPNDRLRLVMPPTASVPLALAFCAVFWLVLGAASAQPFAAGFLGGYLAYDLLHYHVHHHRPRSALGRRLRELHMRHHFQDDERGFGVSAPYWDRVFGTHT